MLVCLSQTELQVFHGGVSVAGLTLLRSFAAVRKKDMKGKISIHLSVAQGYKEIFLRNESLLVGEKFILVRGLNLGPTPVQGGCFAN